MIELKLDTDCIREILIVVEEATTPKYGYQYNPKIDRVADYDPDKIMYHARQCHLSGLFYRYDSNFDGVWQVQDLSPKGHEFLANIRNKTIWKKTKETALKIGVASLPTLIQIAGEYAKKLLDSQL